jgi:NNMT/PNMT/TEMT family
MATNPATPVIPDWAQFDPVAYLDEYYGDIGSENLALLRFLAEAYRQLPQGGVLLDFGGGPTIYPLISAVTRVDEIHFSDYLEANLEEVRRWLAADPAAFDWDEFIEKVLELETGKACTNGDVARRASEIRERVTRLIRCDASRRPAIEGPRASYDVVLTNFCAESATSDRGTWQRYMANIVSLLKPGGWLVMSALVGATRYSVGAQSFPAVDISEDDLVELLEENGCPREWIEVRRVAADRPTRDYKGLMLAVARKTYQPNGSGR